MAVVGVEGKPLRLKDLLELDCDSCSAAGFQCYPRHLCVTVPFVPVRTETTTTTPAEAHSVLGRSQSLRHPMLSIRSLSRRLRGSFSWMRRDEEAAPVVATGSSCCSDYSESSETGSSSSTERKSEYDFSSAASSAESLDAGVTTTTKDGHEHEAMERGSKEAGTGSGSGSGSEADDKEQLSPVAVMDFPFDDDEDDAVEDGGITSDGAGSACSPSFSDSLAQLRQRRNIQLKQKMRHFRTIGEIAAVDLGDRFAALETDDLGSIPVQYRCTDTNAAKAPSRLEGHRSVHVYPDEHDLAALLIRNFSGEDVSERLLLDFFAEARRSGTTENWEAAARLAQDWVRGTGARWGLKEVLCGREELVAEIDRGQRWSSHVRKEEEEREIGVVVAGLVVDEMLRELVNDLLP